MPRSISVWSVALLTAACTQNTDPGPSTGSDATAAGDVPVVDDGATDGAIQVDASVADAGAVDMGAFPDATTSMDASASDATPSDVGFFDAGAPSSGCGSAPGANDRTWTLQHDGRTREFVVHLPPNYDNNVPTPLVFDFHGRAFNASAQAGLSRMRGVADDNGFVVVHPEGIGRTWNGGVCCGEATREGVDDVGFTRRMIEDLTSNLCIDERRVYATGMSNGGFMSHRLACELSDKIAAIAPVAGVLGIANCQPGRGVPVFHFHGTDDNVVGYNGIRGYLSVADSMDGWVARNNCTTQATTFFMQDDVTCQSWTGCDDGAEVRLCSIDGGGHTWPGGTPLPVLGRTTNTINASEMMWDWFQGIRLTP